MEEYKEPYYLLFNGISDIAADMEKTALGMEYAELREWLEMCIIKLRKLQQNAEECFIAEPEIL